MEERTPFILLLLLAAAASAFPQEEGNSDLKLEMERPVIGDTLRSKKEVGTSGAGNNENKGNGDAVIITAAEDGDTGFVQGIPTRVIDDTAGFRLPQPDKRIDDDDVVVVDAATGPERPPGKTPTDNGFTFVAGPRLPLPNSGFAATDDYYGGAGNDEVEEEDDFIVVESSPDQPDILGHIPTADSETFGREAGFKLPLEPSSSSSSNPDPDYYEVELEDDYFIIEAAPDCHVEKDPGNGNQNQRKFYFDPDTNTCKTFFYKGNGGNSNRFSTRSECRKECKNSVEPGCFRRPPSNGQCGSPGGHCVSSLNQEKGCFECCCQTQKPDQSVCSLDKQRGVCGARIDRWFFNQSTGRCETFSFSGCFGNGNNFPCKAMCEDTCGGI